MSEATNIQEEMEHKKAVDLDQYFIDRGYKKYPKSIVDTESVVYNFQKRFDDKTGKKYFIDIHRYTNEWMPEREKKQPWYKPFDYTYSCQLYKKGSHAAVNLEFFSSWTIEEVEEFVESLSQSGELDYYEEWD